LVWEVELARRRHGTQANDAGGRLFGAADHMLQQVAAVVVQHGDQVHAVIHGDVGLDVEDAVQVAVVLLHRLALDGVDRHFVVGDQRGGDVILGAQRVAGGQGDFGAAGQQNAHQVGRLGRHMHGCCHADAFEGLFDFEALLDEVEHGHFLGCPLHAETPALRLLHVCNIVRQFFGSHSLISPKHSQLRNQAFHTGACLSLRSANLYRANLYIERDVLVATASKKGQCSAKPWRR
jgi:hypothetical protein